MKPAPPSRRSTSQPSPSQPSASQPSPGVNYHATSERIHYADLSLAVREAADLALGSPVARAAPPVTSGFTNAYAGGVLLRDGRQAFLKASGPEFPFPILSLGREAQVLEALGEQIPAVPMIGAATSEDGGRVLALEWVEGHLPGLPWNVDEIGLVRSACERVAEVPSSALAALTPGHVVDDLLEDQRLRGALTHGMRLPDSLDLLPPWLPARSDEVLALAADTDALRVRAQDDHLIHFDLRPDNLIIGRTAGEVADRAYVLDWNWVTLGPAWCDWVSVIPAMQAQGHDLGALLDSTPLSGSADPHALDVWLALLAVYMLVCFEDEPPLGATMALRHHQRYYAQVFLHSLATHRGWL